MRTAIGIAIMLCVLAVGAGVQADPVRWSANGHYYDIVVADLCWPEARDLAASMWWEGCQGHLVTITSAEEGAFLDQSFGELMTWCWLGGYQYPEDSAPADNWHWVTSEPWVYTNWIPGGPNDWLVPEIWLEVHANYWWTGAYWNDLGADNCPRPRFVIEYEDQPTATSPSTWGAIKALFE